MEPLTGDWSGKITGTNNADAYVEIQDSDGILSGSARINDPVFGSSVYHFKGEFLNDIFELNMTPSVNATPSLRTHTAYVGGRRVDVQMEGGVSLGEVVVKGTLVSSGRLEGRWTSTIGTGGVFWLSKTDNYIETASKFSGDQTNNMAFIMMSISQDDSSLEDSLNAIKRAVVQHGFDGVRVDEIEHSKKITDVILEKIKTSRFLICDITNERPNVYYELGYAHGIEKEVILVAKQGTPVHFDIKDYNVIFYKNYSELETRVAKRISESIGSEKKSEEVS